LWASHSQKSVITVWRWDKRECELRFPTKELLSVFKVSQASQESSTSSICAGGSKKGVLTVWSGFDGAILAEVESAHYMEINDIDISSLNSGMIVTGGKDSKVKVWLLSSLIQQSSQAEKLSQCLVEFGDHQKEVTQVRFSQSNQLRVFSASLDKQFKVFDVGQQICIKTI